MEKTSSDLAIPGDFLETATPDTRGEVDRAWKKFRGAQDFKKPQSKDWPRWYLLYTGRHWDGRQPDWMSTPVINLTFSVIQTILPILTDSRPQISVESRTPEHETTGSIIGHLIEWLWEDNDMDVKLPRTMLNTLIFGNAFLKVLWDQSARNGLGDIRIVEVDPAHIFISPHARTLEEADFLVHAENLPKHLIKRMFSNFDDSERGPSAPELTLDRQVTSQRSNQGVDFIRNTDGSAVYQVRGVGENQGGDQNDDLVTVIELWERKEDGVVWQTVVANDQLLESRQSPFKHGKFPFVHFFDHPNTWSIWAMGEVQQVERLQIEINRRRGHINDILSYAGNPILVIDPSSGIEYESIVARPGLVLPVEGGLQAVGWLPPPQIPNAMFEVGEVDKRDFDIVLGNVDVLQGRRPQGIEAGVAIEMLQEAANVRMRLKVRYMENSIRKLGELLIGMIQEFYTTERVFRIVGSEIAKQVEPLTKDQFLTINKPVEAQIDEQGNPQVGLQNRIPEVGEAEFNVRVGPGSTLPVSKIHQFQKVLTLYSMQLVDDVEVLKNSGLQRWDEILMRSRPYWAMKQMMASGVNPQEAAPMSDEEVDNELAGGATAELPMESSSEGEL